MTWELVFQIAVLTILGLVAAVVISAIVTDRSKFRGASELIEVNFTEDGDLLKYDDLTLMRVSAALNEAGVPLEEVDNCINEMLSAGILFRERVEY